MGSRPVPPPEGWEVFNNSSTSNTVYLTTNTTAALNNLVTLGWNPSSGIPVEGGKRVADPLSWLHDEVERYVDMGRLAD